jgi:hypothetical protein
VIAKIDGLAKRFLWFTFEREAKWMVALYFLVPLLGILFAFVIPWLIRLFS